MSADDSNFLQSDDEDWPMPSSIANSEEALQWVNSAGQPPFVTMDDNNNNSVKQEDYSAFENSLDKFSDEELLNLLNNPNTNSSIRTSIERQLGLNNSNNELKTSQTSFSDVNTGLSAFPFQMPLGANQDTSFVSPLASAQQIPQPIQQPTVPQVPQVPQPQATASPASQRLEEVSQVVRQVSTKLEKLRWEQKSAPLSAHNRDVFAVLEKEQRDLRDAIEWADKQLNSLLDTMFLESHEMHQVLQLQQELFLHMKQLELFMNELPGLMQDYYIPSFAIVITSQPFPDSVKQHKNLDEPLSVRLLTGAKFEGRPQCVIRADVINTNSKSNKKHAIGLENNEKLLNPETGLALFNDLRFPNGTRLKSIRLKFTTTFDVHDSRGGLHTISLESNPTNPVVVKTNENQWFEAEGILLKKISFGGQSEITWQRFANWLQRRYLGATRQNLLTPVRPLTYYDLQYIHKLKFDTKPVVAQKDFDKFWEWFGPLLHKIRYQRHICSLWTRGYICGFLTREEVDAVLKNEQTGTFLIRFAGQADQFALSYQSVDHATGQTKVKHYLVKADDTHGKKSLPDFLRDHRDFSCLLQLWTDKATQKRILRRCDKESALREFYSKPKNSSHNGYEETIQVTL